MKSKQLSYAPADLRPHYCGYAHPLMLQIQDIFKKQIILLCYAQPKSVSDLSEELQTDYEYIQDAVNELCKNKILAKEEGKFLTQIPMFHLSKNFEATAIKNKLVWDRDIPKKIVDLTFSLKDEISSLDFYGNTFDIKYLNWVFLVMIYNITLSKLRTYFSDKTDEIVLDPDAWHTQHYNASVMISWKYADEHPEDDAPDCKQRNEIWSTYYTNIGDINVNNVFDASPFPSGYDKRSKNMDFLEGRNSYITSNNLAVYLDLVNGNEVEMNDNNKKILEEFLNHGVVIKDGEKLKPMIPVMKKEIGKKIEQIFSKALTPIIKEIADAIGSKIEEILLPSLGDVKARKDQFYSFWLETFIDPRDEVLWYGMNIDGLEIPKNYNQSVAGMWIAY